MHIDLKTRRRLKVARLTITGALLVTLSIPSFSAETNRTAAAFNSPGFSLAGGLYTNSISLVLTASFATDKIRYTLDGSEPTVGSTEYSSQIKISQSTLLKVRTFNKSGPSSPIVSQAYSFIDPDLASFSSNLPLVVLDTFGETVPFGQKIPVAARFIEADKSRSSLLGKPDFAGLGELNVRGHTSLRYPKHSYHFQTKSEGVSQKVPILGLPKESDWVLYAPYSDKSLIRDVLGYELSNQLGRYAARTRLVEVFLNDTRNRFTQRSYLGVYVFEEKIKRGKNRVDI